MVVRTLGALNLIRLMAEEAGPGCDLGWLLLEPGDPAMVEAANEDEPPLAAE